MLSPKLSTMSTPAELARPLTLMVVGLSAFFAPAQAQPVLSSSSSSIIVSRQALNTSLTSFQPPPAPPPSSSSTQNDAGSHHTTIAIIAVAVIVPILLAIVSFIFIVILRRKLQARRANSRWTAGTSSANESRADTTLASTSTNSSSSNAAATATPRGAAFNTSARGMVERFDNWFIRQMQTPNNRSATSARSGTVSAGTAAGAARNGAAANGQGRRGRGRRGRNALQRSDSGATVKTLPEYNPDLGDNEMVLYKAEMSQVDLDADETEQIVEPGSPVMVSRDAFPTSQQRRGGSRSSRHTIAVQTGNDEDDEEAGLAADANLSRHSSLTNAVASGFSALRRSLRLTSEEARHQPQSDLEEGNEMESLAPVHAGLSPLPSDMTPSYDTLYPVISIEEAPSPAVEETLAVRQQHRLPAARSPRAAGNTFRNIFRRQQPGPIAEENDASPFPDLHLSPSGASNLGPRPPSSYESNSLHLARTQSNAPSERRPSTSLSSRRGLGNLFSQGNGSSASLLTSDSAYQNQGGSARAAHQRNISAPLSIRRLQFAAPAAGFSDQQMTFLASVESLDKYGVPLNGNGENDEMGASTPSLLRGGGGVGGSTAPRQRRASWTNATAAASVAPPPSFEQLARQEEAEERRRQQGNLGAAAAARPAPILTIGEIHARNEQQESGGDATSPLSPIRQSEPTRS